MDLQSGFPGWEPRNSLGRSPRAGIAQRGSAEAQEMFRSFLAAERIPAGCSERFKCLRSSRRKSNCKQRESTMWGLTVRGALYLLWATLCVRTTMAIPDTPAQPKITLDQRTGVYCYGDTITVTCIATARGGPTGKRTFELYREASAVPLAREVTASGKAAFRLNATERLVNYRCRHTMEEEEEGNGTTAWSPGSRAVRVFVTEPTVEPRLSQARAVRAFARGESLRLRCEARKAGGSKRFRLYRGDESEAALEEWVEGWRHSVTFEAGGIAQLGTQAFSCSYWRWVSGREIHAQRSDPIAVTVIDRPPRPSLTPDGPLRIFLPNERIALRCEVPPETTGTPLEALLYQEGRKEAEAARPLGPGSGQAVFEVTDMPRVGSRHYACGYTVNVSSRSMESERSRSLKIVTEPALKRPYLYLEAVPKLFLVGEAVRLACQGELRDRSSTFYMYKEGVERPILTGKPRAFGFTVKFDISEVMANGTESYSCTYRRRWRERTALSDRSNSVNITARYPLSRPRLILNVKSGIYCPGEWMTLTCNGDPVDPDGLYYFYHDEEPIKMENGKKLQTIQVLGEDRTGFYQCRYALPTPQRWIVSPLSDRVRVTEIGRCG